ncbi:biotin--[acetyl-CoA-carboxylase] ligase [soil metagenome]
MLSLAGMSTPYSTHVYAEVTSTQDVARTVSIGSPVLVIAASQTAGRGRSGSSWETAPRALAMSLHLLLDEQSWPSERRTLVPLATGVAAARLYDLDLKWPNDLQRQEAKLGGILVEASESGMTVGVGINLWWPDSPSDRTALWADDPGPNAFAAIGAEVGEAIWEEFAKGAGAWSYSDYCAACTTLGSEITWGHGESGSAVAVDRFDGSLLVDQQGTRRVLRTGAVRHVRAR